MITEIPRMETIKATAKLFGLPEHFIRQKVISGEIVSVKAGCKYLVNVDRFSEYLNSSTISPQNVQKSECSVVPVPVKL